MSEPQAMERAVVRGMKPVRRVAQVLLVLALAGCAGAPVFDGEARQVNLFTEERLLLTADYVGRHYGSETPELREPRMVVLHYTAFGTLKESLRFFVPARLDGDARRDIRSGGEVNVSAHYLVDTDGTVYQLAPENVICRHTICFNHVAIGIENVGKGAASLTERQAEANAALVRRILARHPSVTYLIGHQEYRDSSLPHHALCREDDPTYAFTDKIDPGAAFLKRVRAILRERYGIVLKD